MGLRTKIGAWLGVSGVSPRASSSPLSGHFVEDALFNHVCPWSLGIFISLCSLTCFMCLGVLLLQCAAQREPYLTSEVSGTCGCYFLIGVSVITVAAMSYLYHRTWHRHYFRCQAPFSVKFLVRAHSRNRYTWRALKCFFNEPWVCVCSVSRAMMTSHLEAFWRKSWDNCCHYETINGYLLCSFFYVAIWFGN